MLKELNKIGFASMIEVIISTVILIITATGILVSLSMLRPHSKGSSRKIEAAYIGKGIIENLYRSVDADTWGKAGDPLAVGTYSTTENIYTINYEITAAGTDLRQLDMTISWPDF